MSSADLKGDTATAQNKQMSKSLKQKMAKSVAGTGPSLVPAELQPGYIPPAPPKESEEIPTIYQLFTDSEDIDTIRELVSRRVHVSQQVKQLEAVLEPINNRIKMFLGSHGIANMDVDGAKLAYFPTQRKTINAMKLLGAGVEQEIIDQCTDVSTSSTLKVTPPKA
jgi:hypothetical protein